MQSRQCSQLRWSTGRMRQFLFGLPIERLERSIERSHQYLLFGLEIKIDSSVGHAGARSKVGHPAIVKSLFGDYSYGAIQDAPIFVASPDSVRGRFSAVLGNMRCFALCRLPGLSHGYEV